MPKGILMFTSSCSAEILNVAAVAMSDSIGDELASNWAF